MPSDADRRALEHANRRLPTLTNAEARQHARRPLDGTESDLPIHATDPIRSTRPLLGEPTPPVETEPASDEQPDLCDVCRDGDGDLPDDVVANFWDPATRTAHLAHTDCADGEGWQLA